MKWAEILIVIIADSEEGVALPRVRVYVKTSPICYHRLIR